MESRGFNLERSNDMRPEHSNPRFDSVPYSRGKTGCHAPCPGCRILCLVKLPQ